MRVIGNMMCLLLHVIQNKVSTIKIIGALVTIWVLVLEPMERFQEVMVQWFAAGKRGRLVII